ncbi:MULTISPECIES: multidrug effflux MFS transporter [Streptomyces]|uniref:multidrug effflux MFS transporter n=1 Tax=Streptomyces TaxID=1883 RepID=UPI00163BCAED|nr:MULTISPECIES: multidrug effflux MFS transporter [Streptomyces]MBC2878024.1 multidrug effflux MFS transporter [Streptomyces sp. TYQ1024]UBI39978.1 multidrug effflux MFS transporter [Streptomyces mobaraensis]UKW32558.1 multidrug effflux MFS transporter [Streptomyces sp. TYQ1024]
MPVVMMAALVLLAFVMPLATDMYLPAFPEMAGDLHTNASGVQLTLTAFLTGMGLGQLVLGPLSDRFGRRRPILVGGTACIAASALCALAPSAGWLIVLRFVQGFSGAAGVVIGRAVISDRAKGDTAARLFGVLMTIGSVAPVVAPVAGGVVIEAADWRTVFWVLTGVSLLALLAAVFALPESLPREQRHTGGTAGTLRAVREVLADRGYLGYTLCFGMSMAVLFCYLGGSSFLFQNVLGLTVGQNSAALASVGIVSVLASTVITKLVGRFTPAALLRTGLFVMLAATAAALAAAVADGLNLWLTLALLYAALVGICLVGITTTSLALEHASRAAGTGSALLGTVQSVLSAVAAPLVGLGGRDTAVPVFLGMTICAVLALLALNLTRAARPTAATEPAS